MSLWETIFAVLFGELVLLIVFGFMISVVDFWLIMRILATFSSMEIFRAISGVMIITVAITVISYEICNCSKYMSSAKQLNNKELLQ